MIGKIIESAPAINLLFSCFVFCRGLGIVDAQKYAA